MNAVYLDGTDSKIIFFNEIRIKHRITMHKAWINPRLTGWKIIIFLEEKIFWASFFGSKNAFPGFSNVRFLDFWRASRAEFTQNSMFIRGLGRNCCFFARRASRAGLDKRVIERTIHQKIFKHVAVGRNVLFSTKMKKSDYETQFESSSLTTMRYKVT